MVLSLAMSSLPYSASMAQATKGAGKSPAQMTEKWHKLQELIDKEIRVISSVKNIGPGLRYRLLALKTEKIKLTKEKENQLFLDHSVRGKTRGPKESYFRGSKSEARQVEKEALVLMKTYPRFNYTADLLYLLALNDRDYLDGKHVERYLLGALKRAPGGSPLIHATKTSLAEYYYNEKEYAKALRYYEDVLRNKHDEWASKHTTNAAWCYFKVQSYPKSIELLEESFFLSKDKRYIDVSEQTLEAMSVFYVRANMVDRGVAFYLKNAGDLKVTYLLKLAKRATDQGMFNETKSTLETALRVAVTNKNIQEQVDIRLTELEIYRTFKRHDLFYNSAKDIYRLDKVAKIDSDKKQEAIDKIKELVGYLQIRVSRNSKMGVKEYDHEELKQTINYFSILSGLDPESRDQYAFYQGETYFSVGKWINAANAYVRALNTSIKMTKFEYSRVVQAAMEKSKSKTASKIDFADSRLPLKRKIMDSLLAVLEHGEFAPAKEQKLSLYAYKNHVLLWPRDERSQVIYPKLFNIYFAGKKYDDAHWTIDAYNKNYPEDIEKQRQMFTLVLDQYMNAKDTKKVALWIRKLEGGYLSFSKETIVKATILLGNILFEGYHALDVAGKKEEALAGYTSLYMNPQYPKKIKANAALNTSILAGQLGRAAESYDWMLKSQAVMSKEDALKNASKYDALAETYALEGDFKLGAIAAHKNLRFLCSDNSPVKSDLYRRGIEYAIVLHDIKLAFETWKLADVCSLELKEKINSAKQMILFSAKMRDHRYLEALHQVLGGVSELVSVFALSYYDLYWDAVYTNSANSKVYMRKLEEYLSHPDMPSDIRTNIVAMNAGEQLIKKIKSLNKFKFTDAPVFAEDQFNSELEAHFMILKSLSDEAAPLIKSKEVEIGISLYEALIETGRNLEKAILDYTPRGVPPEFIEGFKTQMKSIAAELAGRSQDLRRLSFELRKNSKWMGVGSWSLYEPIPGAQVVLRLPASSLARPMDAKVEVAQ